MSRRIVITGAGAGGAACAAMLAGEAIGLGQTPAQSGNLRPKSVTPVKGLYLVGADAGSRGIGSEIATGSALEIADLLKTSSFI